MTITAATRYKPEELQTLDPRRLMPDGRMYVGRYGEAPPIRVCAKPNGKEKPEAAWQYGDWCKVKDGKYAYSALYWFASGNPHVKRAWTVLFDKKTGRLLGLHLADLKRICDRPESWFTDGYPRPEMPQWATKKRTKKDR